MVQSTAELRKRSPSLSRQREAAAAGAKAAELALPKCRRRRPRLVKQQGYAPPITRDGSARDDDVGSPCLAPGRWRRLSSSAPPDARACATSLSPCPAPISTRRHDDEEAAALRGAVPAQSEHRPTCTPTPSAGAEATKSAIFRARPASAEVAETQEVNAGASGLQAASIVAEPRAHTATAAVPHPFGSIDRLWSPYYSLVSPKSTAQGRKQAHREREGERRSRGGDEEKRSRRGGGTERRRRRGEQEIRGKAVPQL